ncbi:hypothetical protein PPSIR1_10650 [Plesiocystis pacifica SIR-1]|uniref:Uncharacterized protein n=1 Tax=Plesiocystis pacifica SIR-1 TaxID=391625 RepID=A6G4W4_9BACT|nr:hypothetical protein PPSIR1_10650 [Plesiocystis pacifica SIR-1]
MRGQPKAPWEVTEIRSRRRCDFFLVQFRAILELLALHPRPRVDIPPFPPGRSAVW